MILSGHFQILMAVKVINKVQKKNRWSIQKICMSNYRNLFGNKKNCIQHIIRCYFIFIFLENFKVINNQKSQTIALRAFTFTTRFM